MRMRCGSLGGQPQWIDLPVQAHRWLPQDADITRAKLTVTRLGADLRARLSITARLPHPTIPCRGDLPTLAIHLAGMPSMRVSWSRIGAQTDQWRSHPNWPT